MVINFRQGWQTRGRREPAEAAGVSWSAVLAPRILRRLLLNPLRFRSFVIKVHSRLRKLLRFNRELTLQVKAQGDELERLGRLQKLISPQVADAVISTGGEWDVRSYRREIAALFCDLRGFTAFSDNARPNAVIEVLQVYHEALGELIDAFGGTIEHRAGDGIMVIFNAPAPCKDPALRALRLAVAMRERMRCLSGQWRTRGIDLGFGVGMSFGYATLGMVGSEGRFDYVANGRVVNLASRLCDQAGDGQILLSERACQAVGKQAQAECVGNLSLKGFRQPVLAFNVVGMKARARSRRRAHGDERHAGDYERGAGELDWGEWFAEEEIGNDERYGDGAADDDWNRDIGGHRRPALAFAKHVEIANLGDADAKSCPEGPQVGAIR